MAYKVLGFPALKGHGFSRAEAVARMDSALAAEGMLVSDRKLPRGLKPGVSLCKLLTRLKARPFKAASPARSLHFLRTSARFFALCLSVTFLAMLALAPPPLSAQETTFRVDVRLVSVFVNVTDRNGAIVGGLTRDDFAVTEDGRPQQISVFERQSELPLNLTLAIDTSGSVRKDLSEEADAAHRFVHAILRPQDQMSLLQFATEVKELSPFTNKVAQIDRGLNQLHSDYATALYDAILLGSEGLGRRDGRRVLVLVSDGDDTAKSSTYKQAEEAALRHEVMIYSIIDVPIEASAGRDLGGEHALITLAEQTGGKSFYVAEGGLDKAFAQVSDDLRTQYLIGYYPHNQEPGRIFHRIDVTVPRAATQDFNIRHKTGYYGDAPATKN
jgi:Ca-activated chloride channel homolog